MSYSGSNTESNVLGRYKLYNTNKYNSNNNDSIQLEVIIREWTFHPTCWCGILNISHTISFLFSQCPFELDRNHEKGLRVLEGDKVELRIGVKEKDWDSSKNWEICTWTRMRDGANCTFTYTKPRYSPTYNVYQLCHGMKEDPRFHGSPELYEGIKNPVCGITFRQIMLADQGQWKCDLEYIDHVNHERCTATNYIYIRSVLLPYWNQISNLV